MARRKLTVDRHEEIKRRLADGRSLREIATALGCSRRLVRQIRDGERLTHETATSPDPLWMSQLEWPVIIHELGLGHPMKFIWEERAKALKRLVERHVRKEEKELFPLLEASAGDGANETLTRLVRREGLKVNA